eukprot:CAMPEP_0178439896 /NCGR_PEP_ID=MMETSP0689_2-20121128/36436_1 /TAXON_ID=160604 /ORGANISM="Amphidinium massartii, Strain CS-259" /LENGTH=483 /DNA_ID=CAMNT_0020062527 /DNA_START=484 /DNA_END=1935 /DNA_ORIENTATION=-
MNHMFLKGCFALSYHIYRDCRVPRVNRKVILGTLLVGVCTGLDVALSNLSLEFLSASFYTMLKSCSLLFVLLLGVMLQLETFRCSMLGVVLAIALGVLLTSYGEVNFSWWGFTLVLTSELLAAVRWLLTQMLLKAANLEACTVVLYVSPGSTLSLVPLAFTKEWDDLSMLLEPGVIYDYMKILVLPGLLAFALLLVEVQLVKETSSLTMSVFGNLKSVVTILFAIVALGEEAGSLQWLGLFIALAGIFCYSYLKHRDAVNIDETEAEVDAEKLAAPVNDPDNPASPALRNAAPMRIGITSAEEDVDEDEEDDADPPRTPGPVRASPHASKNGKVRRPSRCNGKLPLHLLQNPMNKVLHTSYGKAMQEDVEGMPLAQARASASNESLTYDYSIEDIAVAPDTLPVPRAFGSRHSGRSSRHSSRRPSRGASPMYSVCSSRCDDESGSNGYPSPAPSPALMQASASGSPTTVAIEPGEPFREVPEL